MMGASDSLLWVTALAVYVAGLALLVAMWRAESRAIGTPVPIATIFLVIQHHVFALGGVLLAMTAADAMFSTGLGWFPVTFGLERLLGLELLSVVAAFLGVRVVAWVRRRFSRPAPKHVPMFRTGPDTEKVAARLAAVLCTGSVASVLGAWLLTTYAHNSWVEYFYQVLTYPLLGGFLAAGLGWRYLARRKRWSVIAAAMILALFGLTQGSRSLWLWPGALGAVGFVCARRRTSRDLAKLVVLGALLLWPIAIASGLIVPVRTDFVGERHAVSIGDRLERIPLLLSLMREGYGAPGDPWGNVRVFAERLVEEPARVVVGVGAPPLGWRQGMWRDLLAGLLPRRLFPLQSEEVREPYFLREYGYNVTVGGYVGLGYAFFVDAWRYLGVPGLVSIYAVLGFLLGLLSWKCASYRSEWRRILFGTLMAYSLASYYTSTLMVFWGRVVSSFVVALVWVWLVGLVRSFGVLAAWRTAGIAGGTDRVH